MARPTPAATPRAQPPTPPHAQFRLRLYTGDTIAVGPGKIALLEAIARTGSISAGARDIGMSYRRAWLLMDELNRALKRPALEAAAGGARGGGTTLTPVGEELVRRYRVITDKAARAAASDIDALMRLLAP